MCHHNWQLQIFYAGTACASHGPFGGILTKDKESSDGGVRILNPCVYLTPKAKYILGTSQLDENLEVFTKVVDYK